MRIGHMGALSVGDILEFLAVLEELVRRHGGGGEPGSAVAAAAAVFSS
jgi:aspartate aminotransferase-like enzyme